MDVEHAMIKNKAMKWFEILDGYEAARRVILQDIVDFRATEEEKTPDAIIGVIKKAIKVINNAPYPNLNLPNK